MVRIAGVDLKNGKRVDIALTSLYGVGRSNVVKVLINANVAASKRVVDLEEEEINRLQKAVDPLKVEGDLRAQVREDIKSLREIQTYRGVRHGKSLPVRGQRTRSNARTKRGRRMTIGAIKKELADKQAKPAEAGGKVGEVKK